MARGSACPLAVGFREAEVRPLVLTVALILDSKVAAIVATNFPFVDGDPRKLPRGTSPRRCFPQPNSNRVLYSSARPEVPVIVHGTITLSTVFLCAFHLFSAIFIFGSIENILALLKP